MNSKPKVELFGGPADGAAVPLFAPTVSKIKIPLDGGRKAAYEKVNGRFTFTGIIRSSHEANRQEDSDKEEESI